MDRCDAFQQALAVALGSPSIRCETETRVTAYACMQPLWGSLSTIINMNEAPVDQMVTEWINWQVDGGQKPYWAAQAGF